MAKKKDVTQFGVLITPTRSAWSDNGRNRCEEIIGSLDTMENHDKRDEVELHPVSVEETCEFCNNTYETEPDGWPVCCAKAQHEYAKLHPELDCSEISGSGNIGKYSYYFNDCGPKKVEIIARRQSSADGQITKPLLYVTIDRTPMVTNCFIHRMVGVMLNLCGEIEQGVIAV